MNKTLISLIVLQALSTSSVAFAQDDVITLDLSVDGDKVFAKPEEATSIKVKLKSMLPHLDYSRTQSFHYPVIEGLPKPDASLASSSPSISKASTPEADEELDNGDAAVDKMTFVAFDVKADADATKIASLKGLIKSYLATFVKEQCDALFYDQKGAALNASTEVELSTKIAALTKALQQYEALPAGDTTAIIQQIATEIVDEEVTDDKLKAVIKSKIEGMRAYNWTKSSTTCYEEFNKAVSVVENTETQFDVDFNKGKTTKLEVSRVIEGAKKTWTYKWEAEPTVAWSYTVSFVFVHDFNSKGYFTESYNEEEETFVIRKHSNSGFNYIPAAMFTYVTDVESYRADGSSFGYSAGISMDPEKPGILGGVSYILGKNVTFTLGVAITKQSQLKGAYKAYNRNFDLADLGEGETPFTLKSELSADQLVTDTYKPSGFLAVGFTFE